MKKLLEKLLNILRKRKYQVCYRTDDRWKPCSAISPLSHWSPSNVYFSSNTDTFDTLGEAQEYLFNWIGKDYEYLRDSIQKLKSNEPFDFIDLWYQKRLYIIKTI